MKRLPILFAAIYLCAFAFPGRAEARKLLLAVMDKVSWYDLRDEEVPTLDALIRHGSIAMMVTRTAGGPEGAAAYLTIGAGSRAAALPQDHLPPPDSSAFDVAEKVGGVPAGQEYTVQTGWPVEDAAIVHLGIGPLLQQNLEPSYPLQLGLLGEVLQRGGKRVACIGNADTRDGRDRSIAGLAMNARGQVPLGDVGADLLRRDPSLPYGDTTDPARVEAAVDRAVAAKADVIVLELGETSRAAAYADLLPPVRADLLRLQATATADRLLGRVLRRLDRNEWAVLVVTPSPPPVRKDRTLAPLTPLIFSTPGDRAGLLTSPSTRRLGLVANTDVAATVLDYFGLGVPPDSVGRPMKTEAVDGDPAAALYRSLAVQDALEVARRPVMRAFATFAMIVLWLAALVLFVGGNAPRWTRTLMRGLLLSALAAPLAALLVGLWPVALWPPLIVGLVVVLSPVLALLASFVTRWRRADGMIALAVALAVTVDLFTGQQMLHSSTLSYSATAAARFYGIGNEYAGVLLGALLVRAVSMLGMQRTSTLGERGLLTFGLIGMAALVGAPVLGANFGMALAAGVGLGVFCMYLWRKEPTWRDFTIAGLAVILLAVGFVMADAMAHQSSSHLGLLFRTIRAEGWSALTDVIARKLAMNWTLARASLWTDVCAAALTVFAVAAITRPAGVLQATARWRWLLPSTIACLAGAAASFLLNDSGVVAAAFVLCYGAASLAYLGIGEEVGAAEKAEPEVAVLRQ